MDILQNILIKNSIYPKPIVDTRGMSMLFSLVAPKQIWFLTISSENISSFKTHDYIMCNSQTQLRSRADPAITIFLYRHLLCLKFLSFTHYCSLQHAVNIGVHIRFLPANLYKKQKKQKTNIFFFIPHLIYVKC